MKNKGLILLSFILLVGSIAFSFPQNRVSATTMSHVGGMEIITDTDNKSEYIMTIGDVQTRFIEIIERIDKNTILITTKAYNEETNELLQDYTTTLMNDSIVDQDIHLLEELPLEEPVKNTLFLRSNTRSNASLVTVLELKYTKNFSTGRGTAWYAKLAPKTAPLATSKAFDRHSTAVDSIRSVETGTMAGWLIAAFSGGGLVGGKIISWATAKVIIKNIAGPLAVASNAWALGQWFYYYNAIGQAYYDIK